MAMDFPEKNNFVTANASLAHFDADFATFKKIFPDSPIISSLSNAQAFNKKQLDERMLIEILDAVGADPILKGRNMPAPSKPTPPPSTTEPAKPQAAKPVKPRKSRAKKAPIADKKKADRD